MGEFVEYSVKDHVATITLARPDLMNTFSAGTVAEYFAAIDEADADDDVRCVVVTGSGRYFSAGGALTRGEDTFNYKQWEEGALPKGMTEAERDGGGVMTLRVFNSPKPFVAAINGAAVGAGLAMTMSMDIRVAADTAKLGFAFTQRGVPIDACISWFLPRIVDMNWAAYWCYSGRVFSAHEALKGGLVMDVFPQERLLEEAQRIAGEIASAAPVAVSFTKALLWRMAGAEHPMVPHRVESKAMWELGPRPDAVEGVASFVEKRPAAFPGKVSTDMPSVYPWWTEPEFEEPET